MVRGKVAKAVGWVVLAMIAATALWALNVEIAYRRNARRLPALFHNHRSVITRIGRA